MKQIIFTLFILIYSFSYSQVLTGKVKDSLGTEIPFVSIRIENSSYGTTSNSGGYYQLEVKKGKQIVKYSIPGYTSKIDTVEIVNQSTTHNVTLNEITNQIDEIIVVPTTAKERGKEIMKQVIDKRSYFQDLLAQYSCDTYCFSSLEKEKRDSLITDLVIGKEKLNIIEWRAKTSYKASNNFKDEFYAYNDFSDPSKNSNLIANVDVNAGVLGEINELAPQSIVNSNPYLFVNGIKDAHFSIFDNAIISPKLTQNPIVSPLAYNAFLYYNFYLEKTFIDTLNRLIYELKVIPKFDYEALFKGSLFIKDGSWEITSYDLSINPKILLFYKDLHIICDYQKIGEQLVPVRREFIYTIRDEGVLINGMIRISHKDYTFDKSDKSDKYWLETATFTKDAFDKDSVYWNEKRPFTLKNFEKNFIHEQDSIIRYHETDEYLRKNDSIRNKFSILGTFFGGYSHVNSFKKYEFSTIPIYEQIVPFGVGGFRYRLGGNYQKEFLSGKIIFINPIIDYGFLNKDLNGSINTALMYNPINFSKFGFQIGNTYDNVSGTQNLISILIPKNRVKNEKIELNFSREILNGLYLKSAILYSDRKAIDNLKYPGWVHVYDSLNPQKAFVFERYKILLLTLDFEYHIKSKYMIKKGKKIVFGSPWPTFYLTYKKGIPSIFNSNSNFDFIQLRIQDDINLNSIGRSHFFLDAGTFIQKKELRSIEYKYFRPSDVGYFSNPTSTLQLLDTSLRTPNAYIQINYIHHFNGFFLNKIWLINKLKLEETIGGSFLSIPQSKFMNAEFFVGVEHKYKIKNQLFKIGFYFVTGDRNLTQAKFNFKYGFNYFNNFKNKWDY